MEQLHQSIVENAVGDEMKSEIRPCHLDDKKCPKRLFVVVFCVGSWVCVSSHCYGGFCFLIFPE